MTVDELHGVFQFTDDLFEDAQTPERLLTVDKRYEPRHIYPCWFESGTESIATAHEAKNPIDTSEFLLAELYRRGDYSECLEGALKRIANPTSSAGILRDSAETAALCLLQLNRPQEALPLLHFMTGVEEPGRLVVRGKIFLECKKYSECIKECREYLQLRPGDYKVSLWLLKCLIKTDPESSEIPNLHSAIEGVLRGVTDNPKAHDPRIVDKFQNLLNNLNKINKE
jgi:hypothetical protein